MRLVRWTRPGTPDVNPAVKKFISWGAGPRASQYLILGAKALAAMDGRGVPDIEDVNAMAVPVLAHRVVLNFQAEAEGVSADRVIAMLMGRKTGLAFARAAAQTEAPRTCRARSGRDAM